MLCNEGARARGRLEELEEELIFPNDPNDIALDPRTHIDSVVGSNDYISNREFEEEAVEWVNLLSGSDSE